MKPLFLVITLICFSLACQQEPKEQAMDDVAAKAESSVLYESNGEDFNGWRGYKMDRVPNSWVIDDGAFHFQATKNDAGEVTSERGDIISDLEFDDFELSLEWKIGACGNSGVFYNVVEADEYERTYHTGPEMQVLDNTCHPDAENGPDRFAGANYALHAPSVDVSKPAGEWNKAKLIVKGNQVEHWLNGSKVVEYELHSEDWKKRVEASKFASMPGYATGEKGHIALQDHEDPVWYRNIKISQL